MPSLTGRGEWLLAVYRHAVGLAVEAEGWYRRKRPRKARWGRALRVGAIVLGAVAVILPVLAEISTTNSRPAIAPGWAAIALAAAATLIGLGGRRSLDRIHPLEKPKKWFMTARS